MTRILAGLLDCATVDAKVGLAVGVLGELGLEVQQATLCTRERAAASVIAGWIRDSQDPVLIAIDAPLGWPKPLAETLINHSAGMPIETPANAMFRRITDVFIQTRLGKRPLDVGADRIARTAYAAAPFSPFFAWSLEYRFRWRGRRASCAVPVHVVEMEPSCPEIPSVICFDSCITFL
jgi:hypothetical protein